LCFKEFGDRIKDWITINEPYSYALFGYVAGSYAPGRCNMCGIGNAATEPYMVGHHMLLAHAKAVNLYRDKYKIGISLISYWFVPNSIKKEDVNS
uniref:Beta-glucosidase n=1 Tax=Solanum lycopersicum TaxID=4081 RepID=A0A3Q7F0P9_SOLLC